MDAEKTVCTCVIMLILSFCIYKAIQQHPEKEEFIHVTEVKKIEFENHTYVYLQSNEFWGASAMLHDPNCKCINRK